MATSGENYWPPTGRTSWPLTRALVVKPAPLPSQRRAPGVLMPAGWYPDQQDPSQVRWFNGSEWTAATLPRQ